MKTREIDFEIDVELTCKDENLCRALRETQWEVIYGRKRYPATYEDHNILHWYPASRYVEERDIFDASVHKAVFEVRVVLSAKIPSEAKSKVRKNAEAGFRKAGPKASMRICLYYRRKKNRKKNKSYPVPPGFGR